MRKDICIKHFIKPSLYIKWMGEKKFYFFKRIYTQKLINSILFSLARAMHWCISNLFFGLLSFSRKKIRTNLFNATSRILDNWTNIFSSKREREKKIIILLKRRQIWVVFNYISALNFDMALTKWKQSTLNLNGPQKKTFSKTHMKQTKNAFSQRKLKVHWDQ